MSSVEALLRRIEALEMSNERLRQSRNQYRDDCNEARAKIRVLEDRIVELQAAVDELSDLIDQEGPDSAISSEPPRLTSNTTDPQEPEIIEILDDSEEDQSLDGSHNSETVKRPLSPLLESLHDPKRLRMTETQSEVETAVQVQNWPSRPLASDAALTRPSQEGYYSQAKVGT